jgi:uracil-DNA glycosylase
MSKVQIEESWARELEAEFAQPYFTEIVQFLKKEKQAGKVIYPPGPLIFNAFNTTPFDRVKVVIIGQDPYHGVGQAHGLSFSVPPGVAVPPSLVNIFKEISTDLGLRIPRHGNLQHWAAQGVLMLNAALTVEAAKPMSHAGIGWHHFTDSVIRHISAHRDHVAFLLWGKFAQGKAALIDPEKHLVLTAPHPSPYSASSGFFGCRHFSKTNQWLQQHGMEPIDWSLPES